MSRHKGEKEDEDIDAHWYFGGIASACACCVTHPIDLIRVQTQSYAKRLTMRETYQLIVKYGGYLGLYHGLSSSVKRQLLYSATRFGIYDFAKKRGQTETFRQKVKISGFSGFIAGYIFTPLENVNNHIRTDVIKPVYQRRGYENVIDGFQRLYNEGGVKRLFCPAKLCATRSMFQTIGQISVYEELKDKLIDAGEFRNNWEVYFISSLVASGATAVIISPLEVIKSVRMNSKYGEYRSNMDVVQEIAFLHGSAGFYKGFLCSLLRFVPQTVLTFLIYEKMRINFGI